MDAYERRYKRQLHDIGVAHAIAAHDPGGLEQAFGAPAAPAQGDGEQKKKWW